MPYTLRQRRQELGCRDPPGGQIFLLGRLFHCYRLTTNQIDKASLTGRPQGEIRPVLPCFAAGGVRNNHVLPPCQTTINAGLTDRRCRRDDHSQRVES